MTHLAVIGVAVAVVSAMLVFLLWLERRRKLLVSDNTQLAADQERHGETPCPPSVNLPFHVDGDTL